MSMWSGIGNAEIFERGKFVVDGFRGKLSVKRTIVKQTRKSGIAFIAEFEVLESNKLEHQVGSKVTWFQKMTDPSVAFPAIKGFAAVCAGIDTSNKEMIEKEVSPNLEQIMDIATENPDNPEKNPFIGVKVGLEATLITTQKGLPFTRYDFSPCEQ